MKDRQVSSANADMRLEDRLLEIVDQRLDSDGPRARKRELRASQLEAAFAGRRASAHDRFDACVRLCELDPDLARSERGALGAEGEGDRVAPGMSGVDVDDQAARPAESDDDAA